MDSHSAANTVPSGAPGDDPFFGRMNDPSSWAGIKGLCGDEMEFYLVIDGETITDVRYYTDGCQDTRLCGQAVAERVQGRSLWDALAVSPRQVIDARPELSTSGRHCAILAVTTLYRAIADYLLQP